MLFKVRVLISIISFFKNDDLEKVIIIASDCGTRLSHFVFKFMFNQHKVNKNALQQAHCVVIKNAECENDRQKLFELCVLAKKNELARAQKGSRLLTFNMGSSVV